MKSAYRRLMEWLYIGCIALSGAALVAITLMIPSGVFMRYVMNDPLQWPEPASVIMMVMFSFLGGAAVFRAQGHVAVQALQNAVTEEKRRVMEWLVILCMLATTSFMLFYGIQLCLTTWHQSIAEFPGLSVGLTYTPIPIAGFITMISNAATRPSPSAVGRSTWEITATRDTASCARICSCWSTGKASMMRSTVRAAPVVCSVARTRCPVGPRRSGTIATMSHPPATRPMASRPAPPPRSPAASTEP